MDLLKLCEIYQEKINKFAARKLKFHDNKITPEAFDDIEKELLEIDKDLPIEEKKRRAARIIRKNEFYIGHFLGVDKGLERARVWAQPDRSGAPLENFYLDFIKKSDDSNEMKIHYKGRRYKPKKLKGFTKDPDDEDNE